MARIPRRSPLQASGRAFYSDSQEARGERLAALFRCGVLFNPCNRHLDVGRSGPSFLVEDLRETAFWDRYFDIVEILTGVENAYAKNYDRPVINA